MPPLVVRLSFASKPIKNRIEMPGKIQQSNDGQPEYPNREQEFDDHLQKNGYGYLVEEFLEV